MRRSMYMWSNTRSAPSSCTLLRRLALQLLEQRRLEARARKAQPAELLGIDQAAGAVVDEDHPVFRHDLLAQHGLRGGEAVADHLEDHVEGGQGEAHHHQAALARRRA